MVWILYFLVFLYILITDNSSILSSKGSSGEMARYQCDLLGHRCSCCRRSQGLHHAPGREDIPGYIRGHCRAVANADQQSILHKVWASTQIYILVLGPWSGADHWRDNIIWLPACSQQIRELEKHVSGYGTANCGGRLRYFFLSPRHTYEGEVVIRRRKSRSFAAHTGQSNRYPQQQIQHKTNSRSSDGRPSMVVLLNARLGTF